MCDHQKTQLERMVSGEPYLASDPEVSAASLKARSLADDFNDTRSADADGRVRILSELFGEFGEGSTIRPPFYCDYGFQIFLGERSFVNFGAVFLDVARITIGADAQIGPNVQLLTATHPLEAEPRRAKVEGSQPITLGDNVWLGGGVIVCPGVTIGDNTVVGAGSVVTKDLPPNVVVVGSPARVLRVLPES